MARRMHRLTMSLPPRLQEEIRDLVVDGVGHDWARAVLMANDALIDRERGLQHLEAMRERVIKLLVDLWKSEVLSEQQCARVLDCDLVTFRRLAEA